jgi:hypothetical protein
LGVARGDAATCRFSRLPGAGDAMPRAAAGQERRSTVFKRDGHIQQHSDVAVYDVAVTLCPAPTPWQRAGRCSTPPRAGRARLGRPCCSAPRDARCGRACRSPRAQRSASQRRGCVHTAHSSALAALQHQCNPFGVAMRGRSASPAPLSALHAPHRRTAATTRLRRRRRAATAACRAGCHARCVLRCAAARG